ncbi:uncharacterized protein PGTG_05669 [Puccinia graminis f. sp. tritici CRL 75-36-700-3]|uniref:Uncharacterized protein n=1 Tax=Puccinia graminis f. sp. tritici (strain CRL 75-36-700-3 / race SCCL) TaxID=418459 RepID=E3K533_PUCGT|nr:uncharacterized protein PGTG_05669 [Puccinia graminis f. sp. tritici CRL 75-36-700-3]EFP79348.2 hypothetical protein PGTG_05669 [Puccinia graminis f. sp. tritici CRL 75-36-700-3]
MPPGTVNMPPDDHDDQPQYHEIEMTSSDVNTHNHDNSLISSTSTNPPLNQSRHNPDNQGVLKIISKLIMNPEADGSVIITPDKVQLLKSLIGVEEFINVKTLNMMDKITSRLDAIEKSMSKTVSPTKPPPSTWSSIVKKTSSPANNNIVRPPPSARIINEFKPSFFIIRKTVPEAQAFIQKSPAQITEKVNSVLSDMEAKTDDGTPITVKGAIILPSGDVKFFTPTRFATNWLLEHKHEWTHLCDPALVTPQTSFPVIIHTVPISFTPTNKATIADLCRENNGMDTKVIQSMRWLGNPQANKKAHGSIIMNLLDKEVSKKIERGGLFFKGLFFKGAHYKKSPMQCFQCLEVGHTAQLQHNPRK